VECASIGNINTEVDQNFGVEDAGHLRLYVDDGSNNSFNSSISGPYIIYDEKLNVELIQILKIKNYKVIESKALKKSKDNYRYYD
jgi:hypothetical protein